LLAVDGLTVSVQGAVDPVDIVSEVSLDVAVGETLAIVGESGCGKTTAALSLMGLNPPAMRIRAGSVRFDGIELTELTERDYRRLRGGPMAMVFQDPMSSLNPLRKVGHQIEEALHIHDRSLTRAHRRERAVGLLRSVGIPDPARRADQYPHEYSGGMRQRAMIAIAIANQPRLLIADEPTTALDVTVQAQVIELLLEAKRSLGAALVLVTHDLGLVGELADRIAVMYSGRVVEQGPAAEVLERPQHPYTVGLLRSVPRLGVRQDALVPIPGQAPLPTRRPSGCSLHPRCSLGVDLPQCASELPRLTDVDGSPNHVVACFRAGQPVPEVEVPVALSRRAGHRVPLLSVRGLRVEFPVRHGVLRRQIGAVRAVDGVDLDIDAAETVAVVGESGSGKSTLARAIVGLADITAGSIEIEGHGDVAGGTRDRQFRRSVQLVFQDPYSSLNPRMSLGATVGEPLKVHGSADNSERRARIEALFQLVGLDPSMADRFPHELSGGQRQRIGLARALALDPDLVILDEPVSALDVSVQAQILTLLAQLRAELGLAYLLIAHDLALVEQIADRVAVMYFGRIVEIGTVDEVLGAPMHPYTRALIRSTPGSGRADLDAEEVIGEPPSPITPLVGCSFRSRCPSAVSACAEVEPVLEPAPNGAMVACLRVDELYVSAARGASRGRGGR
jgi:peptide/nickel transport system ATP-binding protein